MYVVRHMPYTQEQAFNLRKTKKAERKKGKKSTKLNAVERRKRYRQKQEDVNENSATETTYNRPHN